MTDVLLVDADSERVATLRSSLQAAGLRVPDTPALSAVCDLDLSRFDCVVAIAETMPELQGDILLLTGPLPCILIDYLGDARRAVAAMKAGAADYLVAPCSTEELLRAINGCCAPADSDGPVNMVGSSQPMAELFELIRKAGPTESAILIEGESGTGKELVARALHSASSRNHAPLITLNCATTPDQLIESELFGYPIPDSSSAAGAQRGLLQAANGGTLFLDEIGELPAKVQARLQEVMAAGTVHELTTGAAYHVDVRLISATHRNLKQLIDNDLFRKDLYYRLNVVTLPIPPLRERGDDILRIAEVFLERTRRKLARECTGLALAAKQAMLVYDWPGNVRELENAIERAVILCNEGEIDAELLAIEVNTGSLDTLPNQRNDQTSLEDYFVRFVTDHQDQLTETELAQKLGISRKSLWERRQRLNIPRKRTKKRGPRRDSS
jgi:two-component system response regulator HydG